MIKFESKNRKGAAAIEFVLLAPLMAIGLMFCFYVFAVCIGYIHYNNLANYIAQSMNTRQSAYTTYKNSNSTIVAAQDTSKSMLTGANMFKLTSSEDIVYNNIPIKGNSSTSTGMLNAIVLSNANKGKFNNIVGCNIKLINADITKNGSALNNFSNESMAGSLIKVTITYTCFGITFTADGFNMIV